MGVFQSTKFCALTAIEARLICLYRQIVLSARYEILLAHQVWDPETVDHVAGFQNQGDGASDGNMDLICGLEDLLRVVILIFDIPPPLAAGDLDRQHVGGAPGE